MNQQHIATMPVEEALVHLRERRRDRDIVISNQSSARLWPQLSQHPLDFNYNPSAMGGAIPLGIGIALARPEYEIIVLSGEGSLLMSLGCLVSAVASGASNLSILLLDNRMYEVTGGQKTAANEAGVDYQGMATAAGFQHTASWCELEAWRSQSDAFFAASGPRFASLRVGATPTAAFGTSLEPLPQRVRRFQESLTNTTP